MVGSTDRAAWRSTRPGTCSSIDTYNQRVEKLAPDGSFVTGWGRRGRDEYSFNYPRTIAVDPDRPVSRARRHRQRPDQELHQRRRVPVGVRVSPAPRSDSSRTRTASTSAPTAVSTCPTPTTSVCRCSTIPARRCTSSASNGRAAGQFKRPRGIVVDDSNGHIFVADATRDVVQEFANDGTYLRSISGPGSTPDKLRQAFDVEVDSQQHLRVGHGRQLDQGVRQEQRRLRRPVRRGRAAARTAPRPTGYGPRRRPPLRRRAVQRPRHRPPGRDRRRRPRPSRSTCPAPPLAAGAANLTGTASDDGVVAGVAVQIEDPDTSTWWQAEQHVGRGTRRSFAATLADRRRVRARRGATRGPVPPGASSSTRPRPTASGNVSPGRRHRRSTPSPTSRSLTPRSRVRQQPGAPGPASVHRRYDHRRSRGGTRARSRSRTAPRTCGGTQRPIRGAARSSGSDATVAVTREHRQRMDLRLRRLGASRASGLYFPQARASTAPARSSRPARR